LLLKRRVSRDSRARRCFGISFRSAHLSSSQKGVDDEVHDGRADDDGLFGVKRGKNGVSEEELAMRHEQETKDERGS